MVRDAKTGALQATLDRTAKTGLWLPGDQYLLCPTPEGSQVVIDAKTGEWQLTLFPLRNDGWLAVSADGHWAADAIGEREVRYVVQTDRGQETLTVAAFAARFQWKNDPTKVRLS